MARKHTGPAHVIVDEGKTGRIIGRRILRRGPGNPKNRVRTLREFALELFQRGFVKGAEYMVGRIHNSVAGLDYGPGYYVPPVVEEEIGESRINEAVGDSHGEALPVRNIDPMSDSSLATDLDSSGADYQPPTLPVDASPPYIDHETGDGVYQEHSPYAKIQGQ